MLITEWEVSVTANTERAAARNSARQMPQNRAKTQTRTKARSVPENRARTATKTEKKKSLIQKWKDNYKRSGRLFDYSLFFIVLFLVCFGLVMLYSTSSYTASVESGSSYFYVIRQGFFAILGFGAAIFMSQLDYHYLELFAVPIYGISLVLQIATLITGVESHGQKRWIELGSIRFQPSELCKLALIIFLALYCSKNLRLLSKWKGIRNCFIFAFPMLVAVAMTNLSTAIIILGISFIIVFIASDKYKMFIGVVAGAMAFGIVGLTMFSYRMGRIVAWLNVETDDNAYQIRQSLYAIGSGGLFGKGLGQSIQKLDYLPEAHNDMIFGVICEELGLFGGAAVIMLFVLLIWRCMIIANNAPDLFGALLVSGIMAQISLQALINIAVATNSIPNTGIPLPFISYGGTNLLIVLGEIGIVLSVSRLIPLKK